MYQLLRSKFFHRELNRIRPVAGRCRVLCIVYRDRLLDHFGSRRGGAAASMKSPALVGLHESTPRRQVLLFRLRCSYKTWHELDKHTGCLRVRTSIGYFSFSRVKHGRLDRPAKDKLRPQQSILRQFLPATGVLKVFQAAF